MSQMSIIMESENESCGDPLLKIQTEINEQLRETESKLSQQILTNENNINSLENTLLNKINHVSSLYNTLSDSIAILTNKIDRLNGYESFTLRTTDQLISHEIRLTNITNEVNNAIHKYDKIYVDNLLLPGYIGEYCKYKNVPAFFEDVLTQLSKLTLAKDKSNVDLKSYKEKLDIIIKNFNLQVSNNAKSNMKYINEITEKSKNLFKEKFEEISDKISEMRVENAKYAIELKSKSIDLSKEWNTMLNIKNEIYEKYDEKVNEFHKEKQLMDNSFNEFKQQFEQIKHKFGELSEFIRDVRFRKNIGGDVKKKEIKNLIKKISFNKRKQSQSQEHSISSKLRNRLSNDNNKNQIRNYSTTKTLVSNNNEDDDISLVAQSLYDNNSSSYQNNINNNNKCEIFLETNDNIIHELAAELEQSAKKLDKEKIKEMTSLLRPNKLNLSKLIDDNISNKNSTNNNSSLNSTNISLSTNKIFNKHFDSKKTIKELEKKIHNLEIFTKEKLLELNCKLDILLKNKSGNNTNESNNNEQLLLNDIVFNHRKHKSFYCSSPSLSFANKGKTQGSKKRKGKENENIQNYYVQGGDNKIGKKQVIDCDSSTKYQDDVRNKKWVPLQVVLSNRTSKNEISKVGSSNLLLDKNNALNGDN